MSYVELKHLLADLALEAVRNPEHAAPVAVALACAQLTSPDQPRVLRRECLRRAATLGAPFGWTPSAADVRRLVDAGLLRERGDLIVLPQAFVPFLTYFKRQTARVLKAIADLRGAAGTGGSDGEAVRVGTVLFNAGLFFECHEWFEGLWKSTAGEPKGFFHGLVQVAAAFYHCEKGNLRGSRTLLGKALARLAPYPDVFLGVDLGRLRSDLAPWSAHLAGGRKPDDFPRIHEKIRQGAPRG